MADARSALLVDRLATMRAAAAPATVALPPTTPPPVGGDATCADLASWRRGTSAPRSAKVSLRCAAAASLSAAIYVGWNAQAQLWEDIEAGKVNGGQPITLSDTRGFGQILRDVPACYTHVSIVGTLSASTLTAEITPLEGDE
jgi:hypothetical protein